MKGKKEMMFHKMLEEKNLTRICWELLHPRSGNFFLIYFYKRITEKILSARQDVAVWTQW